MNHLNYEALVILAEECAEVIQEVSKIQRFHNDHTHLEKEIGDLLCMVDLAQQYGYISWDKVAEYKQAKREKLKEFSNLKGL